MDHQEQESYKQISTITLGVYREKIHTSMNECNIFLICSNEKEVNCVKSQVLEKLKAIDSLKKFFELGLPVIKYTKAANNNFSSIELKDLRSELVKDPQIGENLNNTNICFEIDLRHPKKICTILGIKQLDCMPFLWCCSTLPLQRW